MVFTSLTFLGFFTVLLSLFVFIRTDRGRIFLLLAASYTFYAAWDYRFLLLLLLSGVSGWWLGLQMTHTKSLAKRRTCLVFSLIISLGMLGYFKYANFFLDSFAALFGISELGNLRIILPVGISFFTFQTMSYTIDLYRDKIPVCRDLPKFLLFVAFFPQLVAGPIIRASHFLPQLDLPIRLTRPNAILGAQLFLGGAVQKVLIADNLARFVDPTFADPALYSSSTLWLAVACYSIQIFCDFSGYSLMAIGTGRILGFDLPQNFRMPYVATSLTEFWHRWHISLSTWLRDYLYVPLGGNRHGSFRKFQNVFLTMLLGGLWHGASWNFVVWGGSHGLGLVIQKLWNRWFGGTFPKISGTRSYRGVSWALNLVFIGLLWVPFRCVDFETTGIFFRQLVQATDGIHWMHTPSLVILGAVLIWHGLYLHKRSPYHRFPALRPSNYMPAVVVLGALMLFLLFAPTNTSPFIYFQF